jgi:hypothetical protein
LGARHAVDELLDPRERAARNQNRGWSNALEHRDSDAILEAVHTGLALKVMGDIPFSVERVMSHRDDPLLVGRHVVLGGISQDDHVGQVDARERIRIARVNGRLWLDDEEGGVWTVSLDLSVAEDLLVEHEGRGDDEDGTMRRLRPEIVHESVQLVQIASD